jgi:hypothetical protein
MERKADVGEGHFILSRYAGVIGFVSRLAFATVLTQNRG